MNSWLFIYNNKTLTQNAKNYGWQNPIHNIKQGMTHVFSGNINHNSLVNINKKDNVYIYSTDDNAIITKGKIIDFIGNDNYKFAVIKIEKKGFPLVKWFEKLSSFMGDSLEYNRWGHIDLDDNIIRDIESKII